MAGYSSIAISENLGSFIVSDSMIVKVDRDHYVALPGHFEAKHCAHTKRGREKFCSSLPRVALRQFAVTSIESERNPPPLHVIGCNRQTTRATCIVWEVAVGNAELVRAWNLDAHLIGGKVIADAADAHQPRLARQIGDWVRTHGARESGQASGAYVVPAARAVVRRGCR
jgi:hypothetical protein